MVTSSAQNSVGSSPRSESIIYDFDSMFPKSCSKQQDIEDNAQDKNFVEDFFDKARESLPAVFALKELPNLLPGVISVGTIHNHISFGTGPKHLKLNGKVCLERDSFVEWIKSRTKRVVS